MIITKYQPTIDDITKQIFSFVVPGARDRCKELFNLRDGLLRLASTETINNGNGQKKPARRTLSASGRKSIAEAQRKRWAEQKRKARARKKKVTPPA